MPNLLETSPSKTDIPPGQSLGDAATVAFVGCIHALSELKDWEVLSNNPNLVELQDDLQTAISDITGALSILAPHIQRMHG